MSQLTDFYEGAGRDAAGRTLDAVLGYDDATFEDVHDFIQWLFPLREASRFNSRAPLLTAEDERAFRERPELRDNLRRSFVRFLAFLGLAWDGARVVRGAAFDRKSAVWKFPNHNWLRITRVLASTRLLGLEAEGRAFFGFLDGLRAGGGFGITADTFAYWKGATEGR